MWNEFVVNERNFKINYFRQLVVALFEREWFEIRDLFRNNLRKLMAPFSLSCHFTGKENYNVQMDGFLRIENPKLRFIPIAVKNWTRMGLKKRGKNGGNEWVGPTKIDF